MINNSYDLVCDDIRQMIGISEADFVIFRKNKDFFLDHADALISYIRDTLMENESTRFVFEEKRGDVAQLGQSLVTWLGEVLEGHDDSAFWRRHYLIGIQHIQRKIPNRHMQILSTQIRELLLPLMLEKLGREDGLELYLSFQRFLDAVVALTTSLVDLGQARCLSSSTGMSQQLLDRLQATAYEEIEKELRQST